MLYSPGSPFLGNGGGMLGVAPPAAHPATPVAFSPPPAATPSNQLVTMQSAAAAPPMMSSPMSSYANELISPTTAFGPSDPASWMKLQQQSQPAQNTLFGNIYGSGGM